MKVEKNRVVTLDYSLEVEGKTLENSFEGGRPLRFILGKGVMLPSVEKRIEGMESGEDKEILIPAAEGYAPETQPTSLLKAASFGVSKPEIGMRFEATKGGKSVTFEVVEVKDEQVKVRFCHPLEGKDLRFRIKISHVRGASPMELEMGMPLALPPKQVKQLEMMELSEDMLEEED